MKNIIVATILWLFCYNKRRTDVSLKFRSMKTGVLRSAVCMLAIVSADVRAVEFTGTINWMEVWRSGNVAFTLSPAIASCNGQVILNLSDPGLKSMFATILAAKEAGHAVRIYTMDCGPAEGYGGSYNIPLYIYPL